MSCRSALRAAVGTAAVIAAIGPSEAQAAGGLFAHQGATPANIEVTKVTAIVVPDPFSTAVELHLQLTFEINQAELLAWVVPLPGVGTVSVGSQRLYANLDIATIVSWQTMVVPATCADASEPPMPAAPPTPDNPRPPNVIRNLRLPVPIAEQTLPPGTNLVDYLLGRGYLVTAVGNAALDPYVSAGWSAAILDVPAEAGPNVTHPFVFRWQDGALTLPTTLLALNAGLGAPVELYVLAAGRGAPEGAAHVVLNPVRIDWLRLGDNYRALLDEALDDPAVDSSGWVTDAVVPALDVSREGLVDPRWDPAAFMALPAASVPNALIAQGLYTCPEIGTCEPQHPLVERILAEYFLPSGVSLGEYRACQPCFEETVRWQPGEFAAAFEELVVEPGVQARAVTDRATVLTRMRGRARPTDPILRVWRDGPMMPGRHTTRALERCDGDLVARLPDGRELYVRHSGPWPDLAEQMSAIDRIERIPTEGDPTAVIDNRETIDARLAEHNDAHGWPIQRRWTCHVAPRPPGSAWWLLALLGLPRRARSGARDRDGRDPQMVHR